MAIIYFNPLRQFEYRKPFKVTKTSIINVFVNNNSATDYHERSMVVITKLGICLVYDFNWLTNRGIQKWTQFQAVVDGYEYYALVNESKMSDLQIKWLATNFMNTVLKMSADNIRLSIPQQNSNQ